MRHYTHGSNNMCRIYHTLVIVISSGWAIDKLKYIKRIITKMIRAPEIRRIVSVPIVSPSQSPHPPLLVT